MKPKRLGKGDKALIKPCLFYPYNGSILRDRPTFMVSAEEIGTIIDVVENSYHWPGRHLIVQLSSGTIDI